MSTALLALPHAATASRAAAARYGLTGDDVQTALAKAKHRVAREMESGALAADATQTSLCAYLSAIALAGVGLNWWLGWWWADPIAALGMVPIIAKEGIDGIRAKRGTNTCYEVAIGLIPSTSGWKT